MRCCLLSARYRGPEQEIWSLGVTLYTLVMRENPFENIDDAIVASYSIPLDVSIGSSSSLITNDALIKKVVFLDLKKL